MKAAMTHMITRNKRIISIIITIIFILLIPLVAMQFTDEVKWGAEDFIVIGMLLFSVGFVYEAVARRLENDRHRLIFGSVCMVGVLLVWVELAVGIFD